MADKTPQTLAIELPNEPPDGSVVLAGGPEGDVWQRKDEERWYSTVWGPNWFPACRWWDDRVDDTCRNPLPWRDFVAKRGPIHILRWGDGKASKESSSG